MQKCEKVAVGSAVLRFKYLFVELTKNICEFNLFPLNNSAGAKYKL